MDASSYHKNREMDTALSVIVRMDFPLHPGRSPARAGLLSDRALVPGVLSFALLRDDRQAWKTGLGAQGRSSGETLDLHLLARGISSYVYGGGCHSLPAEVEMDVLVQGCLVRAIHGLALGGRDVEYTNFCGFAPPDL